jgi:outer membrane protein with beta-barrel domain
MKRSTIVMSLGVFGMLVAATGAQAQYIYGAAGANVPVGTFKDAVKTGWIVSAGVGADVGKKGLWVEAEGWYGHNKYKAGGTYGDLGKTALFSGLGVVGWSIMPDKSVTPYLAAGAGFLNTKYSPEAGASSSKTKFAYTGAGGLSFKAGSSTHIFIEARYLAATGKGYAKMLPITAGFSVEVGKKKM